jgi:transcriptional regulator with XRE-family HTH domain
MAGRFKLKHGRLASAIRRSRLSQNHWALRLGLDRGHFSQLVRGKRPYPSAETRRKLLDGLGLGSAAH